MSTRKPRGDSKLDALPPEQQERLSEWLTVENLTYAEAQARVREEMGVSTSRSALASFYGRVAAPWKYARARGVAENLAGLAEGKFDEASIKVAKQLAFDALSGPQPDLKAAKTLFKVVGDSAKLKLQARELELSIEKFREAVKGDVDRGLDALHAEVKGNPEALELFQRFRAVVLKSVQEAQR
jgi:hypothetical protein